MIMTCLTRSHYSGNTLEDLAKLLLMLLKVPLIHLVSFKYLNSNPQSVPVVVGINTMRWVNIFGFV